MARKFGGGSYLEVDSAPTVPAPMSMHIRVKRISGNTGTEFSLADSGAATHFFQLMMLSTALARWRVRGAGDSTITTTNGEVTGTFNSILAVANSTTDRFIVMNGDFASRGQVTGVSAVPSGINRVSVSRLGDSSPGSVANNISADAAIWNVALVESEADALAVGVSPLLIRPSALVFYAPLYRDEDRDIVGGRLLTAFNSPTIDPHAPIHNPTHPLIVPIAAAAPAVSVAPYYYNSLIGGM